MVSTVTWPVTATVVVVGGAVVVWALHSLQLSQFLTSPSPPTAVAHQEEPWKSMQANCSLGGEDPFEKNVLENVVKDNLTLTSSVKA